jgi:hypothetical protein
MKAKKVIKLEFTEDEADLFIRATREVGDAWANHKINFSNNEAANLLILAGMVLCEGMNE